MKDARVIIRPSGTEPKLKCYLQVVVPVTGDVDQARAKAQSELDAVRASVAETLALRRWLSRAELSQRLRRAQADPGLRGDLAALMGDTTDDLGPIQ
jgi:hypothetical protein